MITQAARSFDATIGLPGRLRRELVWQLSPTRWRNQKAISRFHNVHKGERCFVMGNGPSLKTMDLSPLAYERTFGLNRIYLAFDKLGFNTSYFVAINKLVLQQFGLDIQQLPMPKFISWDLRHLVKPSADLMYVRSRARPSFSYDLRRGAWEGATVTYMALQLAYFMGFQQAILIGVDHEFQTKGPAHKEVTSERDDPDHFAPEYFGKGVRWQLPDLEVSEFAYGLAKEGFEKVGRSVLDATAGGKLNVFPKVSYEAVVSTPPQKPFLL